MKSNYNNNSNNRLHIINKLKILCWLSLIVVLIIKLIGVNVLKEGLTTDWLIKLNDFVSKRKILQELLNFISAMFTSYMISLIISRKAKLNKKNNFIVISGTIIAYLIKLFIPNISIIGDIMVTFIIPIIICKEDRPEAYLRCWVSFILMNIFQMISLIIRIGELKILEDNIIYNLIMLIDYYIMLILYYIYSIELEKGGINMGKAGWWWFANDTAYDKGYAKFVRVIYIIGVVITFPVSVPYLLWKKHQIKKKRKEVK